MQPHSNEAVALAKQLLEEAAKQTSDEALGIIGAIGFDKPDTGMFVHLEYPTSADDDMQKYPSLKKLLEDARLAARRDLTDTATNVKKQPAEQSQPLERVRKHNRPNNRYRGRQKSCGTAG